MKKEYRKPELLVSLFDTRDVITGSGGSDDTPKMSTADSAIIGGATGGGSITGEIDYNGSGLD